MTGIGGITGFGGANCGGEMASFKVTVSRSEKRKAITGDKQDNRQKDERIRNT